MLGQNAILGILVFFLALYYSGRRGAKDPASPVLRTSSGKIRGLVSTSGEGRILYKYLGIPYAKPPLGELRFEPPQAVEPWDKVKDAKVFGPRCLQLAFLTELLNGNEDCLYLNVFTPVRQKGKTKDNRDFPESKLPVYVWIHGGAFIRGSADLYGPDYFYREGVEEIVLVTLNYRLSALGFLNTGDGVVGGNMGLMDQSMALKWVRENIYFFGGDPDNVIIFGESAGAASVHYQLLSERSKGLFSKAISQSGSALNHWAFNPHPKKQAEYLARELGCPYQDSEEMVKCLKGLEASEIISFNSRIKAPVDDVLALFRPTIDSRNDAESFITQHPEDIIKSGKFNKVPWISGVNSEEGLLFSAPIMRNDERLAKMDRDWEELLPSYLDLPDLSEQEILAIRKFYFGSKSEQINWDFGWKNLTDMFTDRSWYVEIRRGALLHSLHHPVYLYYFNHPGQSSLANLLMSIRGKWWSPLNDLRLNGFLTWFNRKVFGINPPFYGVCHADEMWLLFNTPFVTEVTKGSPDYQMSRDFVKLWISFGKKESKMFQDMMVDWDPLNPHGRPIKYLNIGEDFGLQIKEPFENRMHFWQDIIYKDEEEMFLL